MNKCPNAPSRPIRRQTFNGADFESLETVIKILDFEQPETPQRSPKALVCPGAPSRNIQRPFVNTIIEISPLVLNFDSDNDEEERISPPPTKRRRTETPGAPAKEQTTQSRLSEAIEQSLVPISLTF